MARKKSVDSGLIYVGEGSWIPEVPARDLTPEEAKLYAPLIEAVQANGAILYRAVVDVEEEEKDGVRAV